MTKNLIHTLAKFKLTAARSIGVLALVMTLTTHSTAAMPENYTPPERYNWSAELVEVDSAQNLVTVRARVATQTKSAESAGLETGEHAFLTWSGLRFAHAVRAINRTADDAPGPLTIPIRFEGLESDGRYVSFSIIVPESTLSEVRQLSPGHWITATSLSHPFDSQEAVVAIRPYNDVE
jgi:hypothetical protein